MLPDPDDILIQQTENVQSARQVRFTDLGEITKLETTLKEYIKKAIKVEKAGLKVELKKTEEYGIPEEFKKQLKIRAVQAAKEKAGYLAEAIGENIGVAVTIHEPQEFYQPYMNVANARYTMAKAEGAANDQPQADFKKIKLKYDVNVVFALQ